MEDDFSRKALNRWRHGDADAGTDAQGPLWHATPDVYGSSRSAQDLHSSLRCLWTRRSALFLATVAGGALAFAAVSSLPPLYTGEARVLVGLQGPRVLNVEAVIADISPDAERVQNESYVLQSRQIAAQASDLRPDEKCDEHGEWREVDGPSIDDRQEHVVLDLLVNEQDDYHNHALHDTLRECGDSADGERDGRADLQPDQ